MQTTTQKILAPTTTNQNGFQAPMGGRTFLIQASDAGNVLTVTLADAQGNRYTVQGVGAGFKASPMAGFNSVAITTTADSNVQFITTDGDVDLQLSQVNTVIANSPQAPANVQVQGQGTTAGNPLYVNAQGVTLNATNVGVIPSGTATADNGSVAVGTTNPATQILAAAAGRKRAIFYNAGAGKLALTTAAGTTFAQAALVLQPGDAWKETDAPQLAWYAISDTGTTVNIQTVS